MHLGLIKGHFTIQRNVNMQKILKKVGFADYISFFAKMQFPVCHPNTLILLW